MSSIRNFQYSQRTNIHSGVGCIKRIPKIFKGYASKRVVLFSDKGLAAVGVVDKVAEYFSSSTDDMPKLVGIYTDIEPDASFSSVNKALQFAKEMQADGLLAVGGGSVIDAVKGVKYALHHGHSSIESCFDGDLKMESWPKAQPIPIPHIAVPTTAGTGSEISSAAVFYNEKSKVKASLISPFIGADIAMLDPELTLKLPPSLTASTGMDALTHALEAVASPNENHFTTSRGIYAAQLIEKNLPEAVKNGAEIEYRANMMQASTMALDAFGMAVGPIPVHNCAHAFGAMYHIPHGDANAVLLPIVIESIPEFYLPSSKKLAQALNIAIDSEDNSTVLSVVISTLKDLQVAIGCQVNFGNWQASAQDKDVIKAAILADPASMFYKIEDESLSKIIVSAVTSQ